MKIWLRLILGVFLLVGIGVWYLIDWVVDDLTPQYRESTEEPLVDAARILASVAAATATSSSVDVELFRRVFNEVYTRTFSAQIYGLTKTHVDYRVYMTDATGTVIFDSDNRRAEGQDYSQWRDVYLTLKGQYGARTSRDTPDAPDTTVLYVAAPIIIQGETVGVLSIGKPTTNIDVFIAQASQKFLIGGAAGGASLLLLGLLLSTTVSRPLARLTTYARAIRDGRRVSPPALGGGEIGELGAAFEEMRDALEGKHYVEHYVQTLTHEIKGPLAAIHGAAELLQEGMDQMPSGRRAQFVKNIHVESQRITDIVEKLLLLSSLEKRKNAPAHETIVLWAVVLDVSRSFYPVLESKHIGFTLDGDQTTSFRGEAFLVRQAVANLMQNALDFTPVGGKICATIERTDTTLALRLTDTGTGVPSYALQRIFERFYSLRRPDTGKKSSGLGLSLVKEVAILHGGEITIKNRSDGGVEARLSFPSEQLPASLSVSKISG